MLRCVVFAIGIFWHIFALSQQPLLRMAEPFASYTMMVANDPQAAIDKLSLLDRSGLETKLDKAQYHLLLSQAYYHLTYPQKSFEHIQVAIEMVHIEHQPWLYHNAQIWLANALELLGQPLAGLEGLNLAIEWAKSHQDQTLYLQGLLARGTIFSSLSDSIAALSDFQLVYSLTNTQPNSLNKGHAATMIAQVYELRWEDELAIPFFEQAVDIHRANQALLDLSNALFGLGKANRFNGNLALGKQHLLEAAEIAAQINDQQTIGYALRELAGIDMAEGKYAEAKVKLLQAVDIFAQADNREMNYNLMMSLAYLYLNTQKYQLVTEYLQQAEQFLDRTNMPLHSISYDEFNAGFLYRQQHYKTAYEEINKAFSAFKQYQNANSTERLHELRSRFEMQLAQQENAALAQKNTLQHLQISNEKSAKLQWLLLSVFSIIACLLLAWIIYRKNVYKRKLERLVTLDELTGLYNRRHTYALLEQQIKLASRHKKGLCIAMVDLDFFKQINDSYGHLVGDKVLKEFAQVFSKGLRSSDVIGRIGGEEFLIILNYSSSDDAYLVLTNLCQQLSHIGVAVGEPKVELTISAGLVEVKPNDTLENIIYLADTVLYRAKNNGRAQVVIADRINDSQSPVYMQC